MTTTDDVLALPTDAFYAIDIETRGLQADDPASEILGIGLANAAGCYYADLRVVPPAAIAHLRALVVTAPITVFNSLFDCAFLQVWAGKWPNLVGDSYALFKALTSEGWTGQSWSLSVAIQDVLGWPVSNKATMDAVLKERRLTKGDLWQLPPEVLGEYCALDAEAARQLWDVLMDAAKPFPHLLDYHQRLVLTEIRLLAEQQLRGIQVDQTRLEACRANNEAQIAQSMSAFLDHPDVAHHIGSYNKEVRDAWIASEPPKFNKDGVTESARWRQWRDREATWMADRAFNPNSKPQLASLFYDKLGNRPLKHTETGRRVVDRKVLPSLGEPGKALAEYNVYLKRRGYIAATIDKSARYGCIHPQFNAVGAITGRLGGSGGWNAQQMPKSKDFLECLRARPGHKLVQLDFAALEPMVLAEFSQDKTLLAIYGPTAKPNDIYLYIAAKIPALGKEIRTVYDPDHPTDTAIAKAKKLYKRQRQIAKVVQLASSYGAGAPKIHETLVLGGVDISLREVRAIHADYWRLFAGVKRFEETLKEMWSDNGGWIPNAMGRPLAIHGGLLRDSVNRMVQTSGHDILQLFIWNADRLRQERGLTWAPWIVDLHDETIVECPEAEAEAVAQSFRDALAATNAELGMAIQLKGEPQIADSLADIKIEG